MTPPPKKTPAKKPVGDGVALIAAAHPVGKGRVRKREPSTASLTQMPAPPAIAAILDAITKRFKAEPDEIKRALKFYRAHRQRQRLAAQNRRKRQLESAP